MPSIIFSLNWNVVTSGKFCQEFFMSKSQSNIMKRKGCKKNEKCWLNSHHCLLKLHILLITMHTNTLHFPTFTNALPQYCACTSNYYLLLGYERKNDFKKIKKLLKQVLSLQEKHWPHENSWKVTIKAKNKQGLLENIIAQHTQNCQQQFPL